MVAQNVFSLPTQTRSFRIRTAWKRISRLSRGLQVVIEQLYVPVRAGSDGERKQFSYIYSYSIAE